MKVKTKGFRGFWKGLKRAARKLNRLEKKMKAIAIAVVFLFAQVGENFRVMILSVVFKREAEIKSNTIMINLMNSQNKIVNNRLYLY
jgi:hypothetical protein